MSDYESRQFGESSENQHSEVDNEEASSTSRDHHNHAPASAPTAPQDDNGYIVVPPTPQSSVDLSHHDTKQQQPSSEQILSKENQEEISKMLVDISNSVNETTTNLLGNLKQSSTVFAEADSSSSASVKSSRRDAPASSNSAGCSLCPYYLLACDYVTKIEVPPKVKDLLLWTNPKLTGSVFGSAFVLLLSLSLFSFLTVVSSLSLLALVIIGSYRFYLALMFRIKGVHDPTFDKLSEYDLSLPKDKVKQLANLLETDINKVLNQVKSILIWDNVLQSSVAFASLYFIYCVGCVFNTLTLFILALVSAFTLPKVYQVYKVPIDSAVEQATASIHLVVKQAMAKVPFLNKKKTQ